MKPVLSVIITTYNRPDLLIRAIGGVFAQDFLGLEVIVIDDASTMDVLSVLREKFISQMSAGKLRYTRNQTNRERGFCRNLGMSQAQGDFFAFLDDDDLWLPAHAREMLDFFGSNLGLGMVVTNYWEENENGKKRVVYSGIKTGQGELYRQLCVTRRIISGSIYCIRKEVHAKLGGFREGLEPAEDREYLIRIAMNYNVGYISAPSVLKFIHRGSFSGKISLPQHAWLKEKIWFAVEENSRKFSYPLNPAVKCDWYLHLAVNFLPDLAQARHYLKKAVNIYPRCIFYPDTLGLIPKVIMGSRLYAWYRKVKFLGKKT